MNGMVEVTKRMASFIFFSFCTGDGESEEKVLGMLRRFSVDWRKTSKGRGFELGGIVYSSILVQRTKPLILYAGYPFETRIGYRVSHNLNNKFPLVSFSRLTIQIPHEDLFEMRFRSTGVIDCSACVKDMYHIQEITVAQSFK